MIWLFFLYFKDNSISFIRFIFTAPVANLFQSVAPTLTSLSAVLPSTSRRWAPTWAYGLSIPPWLFVQPPVCSYEIGQQGGYSCYNDENTNNQAPSPVMTKSLCTYLLRTGLPSMLITRENNQPAAMKESGIWNTSLITACSHFIQHIMNHPFK